jgi:nucleoside-diphosphate-sugar epimerase
MPKINVFVTGASSQLMQKFCEQLPPQSYHITGLSRKPVSHGHIQYIIGDLAQPNTWTAAAQNADIIIHAAGLTHSYNEADYFTVNTQYTKQILQVAQSGNCQKFVYISSRAAEPNSGGYGLSKLAAENHLKQYCSNYLILRPAEIYGGIKGEGIDKLITDALYKTLVVCPSHQSSPMAPIFVDDVIALMYQYIAESTTQSKSITLNGPQAYTMQQVVQLCASKRASKPIILTLPKFGLVLLKYILKVTKLKIGLYPDQIDRLYCPKVIENLPYNYTSLPTYIQALPTS